MAIITCPNCGKQISDKAENCVHCGTLLQLSKRNVCTECGTELEDGIEICPSCGCPIDQHQNIAAIAPQQVEITGVRMTNKIKKVVLIAGTALILIIVAIFGIVQVQKKKAAEEAKKTKQEYVTNLNTITYTMLDGCSKAETCCNMIKSVWSNAIYEEEDKKTDKYTRPYGFFLSDFNDALENLFDDSSFLSKVDNVSDNQDMVNSLMKKMKKPPEEYKEAHDKMLEFYDEYIILTNLATNPSGSLQTYSNSFNESDTKAVNCYKALEVYLEE